MRGRRTGKLGRVGPKSEAKARFILFCEGKNTEPTYFAAIKRKWRDALVKIEIRRDAGTPITIAQMAVKYARKEGLLKKSRHRKSSFEENDRVWTVFDRDDHRRCDEAIALCEKNGIELARSNPCFELWLILHERDFDRLDGRQDVQRELTRLRNDCNRRQRKVVDCEEIVNRLLDAERRSGQQLRNRVREGDPFGRPSTTVGKLTKEIREAHERARRDGQLSKSNE